MLSNIQLALAAHNPENYMEYDDSMFYSKHQNAEKALIEKDNFEKLLSPKTKYVIWVILQEPPELFSPKRDRGLTWTRLREYMVHHCNFKWKEVYQARKEIMSWLNENL